MQAYPAQRGGAFGGEIGPEGTGKGADDDVRSRFTGSEHWGEQVSQLAAHPMPGHGIAHLLAHDKTRPRRRGRLRTGHDMDHKMLGDGPATLTGDEPDIRRPAQPLWLRQHSDGDFVAALAAACRKDRAAGAGAHAKTEAVLLVATTVVRLESTLHDELRNS